MRLSCSTVQVWLQRVLLKVYGSLVYLCCWCRLNQMAEDYYKGKWSPPTHTHTNIRKHTYTQLNSQNESTLGCCCLYNKYIQMLLLITVWEHHKSINNWWCTTKLHLYMIICWHTYGSLRISCLEILDFIMKCFQWNMSGMEPSFNSNA